MNKSQKVKSPNIFKQIKYAFLEKKEYNRFVKFIESERTIPTSPLNVLGIEFTPQNHSLNFIIPIPSEFIGLSDFEVSNMVTERQKSHVEYFNRSGFGYNISLEGYNRFSSIDDKGKTVPVSAIGVVYTYDFVFYNNLHVITMGLVVVGGILSILAAATLLLVR